MAKARNRERSLDDAAAIIVFQDRGIANSHAGALRAAYGGTSTIYKNADIGLNDSASDIEIWDGLAKSSQTSRTILLTNDLSKGDSGMRAAQDQYNNQDSHIISVELSQNFRSAPEDIVHGAMEDSQFIKTLKSKDNAIQKIRLTGGKNGSPVNYRATLRDGKIKEWERST